MQTVMVCIYFAYILAYIYLDCINTIIDNVLEVEIDR